jgi:hypothetical protein
VGACGADHTVPADGGAGARAGRGCVGREPDHHDIDVHDADLHHLHDHDAVHDHDVGAAAGSYTVTPSTGLSYPQSATVAGSGHSSGSLIHAAACPAPVRVAI